MSFSTKLERYIKFIPPLYSPTTNKFVNALLQAWSVSDAAIESANQSAKQEIFLVTANGTYLNSIGQNVGVDRPASIGLSDAKFAQLIPALSYQPKQVVTTMYNILDVFWGPLYSRTNVTSLAPEPYNLGNIDILTGTTVFQNGNLNVYGIGTSFTLQVQVGSYIKFSSHPNSAFARVSLIISDTQLVLSLPYAQASNTLQFSGIGNVYYPENLTLMVDDGPQQVIVLTPNLIQNPASALAEEIVNTINAQILPNATSQTVTASVMTDYVLGTNYINIRTNTPGSSGTIFITGGTANVFAFTNQNNQSDATAFYGPAIIPGTATAVTLTANNPGAMGNLIDLIFNGVININTAIINWNTLNPSNQVSLSGDGTQVPTTGNVQLSQGTDSIYVSNASADLFSVSEVIVVGSNEVPPITTTITLITPNTPTLGTSKIDVSNDVGAYFQEQGAYLYPANGVSLGFIEQKTIITMLSQSTVIYETVNREIIVQIPSTIPAVRRNLFGSAHLRDGWRGSVVSVDPSLNQVTVNFEDVIATTNEFKGDFFSQVLENFEIISNTPGLDGVILQLEADVDISGISTLQDFCILSPQYIGSFMYNTVNAPFTVSSQACQLNQVISRGQVFPAINVLDAGGVSNSIGYLVFNYGRNDQEGPVKYRGRPNNNTLLLDPTYNFVNNHEPGEYINALVLPLGETVPRTNGQDYAAYIVGSADAEEIIEGLLESVKAAGVFMIFDIIGPTYLWNTARPVKVD